VVLRSCEVRLWEARDTKRERGRNVSRCETYNPLSVNVFRLRVESVAKPLREEGQRDYVWVSPGEAGQMVQEPELQIIFRRFANEAWITGKFT
jgi:hypothetical protein